MTIIFGGAGGAVAAPWCAWYDPYTYNCGYYTFEQCLATVRGNGGFCYKNVYEPGPVGRYRSAPGRY